MAERRGSGLQSRLHGFESRLHLKSLLRAIGAAVARFPDTEEVTGSNPVSPTSYLVSFKTEAVFFSVCSESFLSELIGLLKVGIMFLIFS